MATHIKMTAAKAKFAAFGATCTALATAVATATVLLEDGKLGPEEYGAVAGALVVLISTIYGVWRTPNQIIEAPDEGPDDLDGGTVSYQRGQFPR